MTRRKDNRIERARDMFITGCKLKDIAIALNVPEGTIRSWKNRCKWECNVAKNATQRKQRCTTKTEEVGAEKNDRLKDVEKVIDNPDLTNKQRLFCLYYSRSFNATSAYMRAYGGNRESALRAGPRMLGNVGVQEEIQRLKQARYSQVLLKGEDIFQKYMDIAFADLTDYVEFGREEIMVLSPSGGIEKKKVNTVRFKESSEVDGTILAEVKQGRDGVSVKLNDRMRALEWLADHMELATPEQKARTEKCLAEVDRIRREDTSQANDGVEIINDAEKASQNQ